MSNVNVSKDVEFAVIKTLSSIFNDVSYIDSDVLSDNLDFMCDITVPLCYKSVPTELLDYIIDNMGYLYFALLVDSQYRQSIKNSYIPMMYKFDKLPGKELSNRSVVDFSLYNHDVYMSVLKRITNSMNVLDDYNWARPIHLVGLSYYEQVYYFKNYLEQHNQWLLQNAYL